MVVNVQLNFFVVDFFFLLKSFVENTQQYVVWSRCFYSFFSV